jgi:chromosome segregation ATPase
MSQQSESTESEEKEKKDKKPGFFSKLFGGKKKEEKQENKERPKEEAKAEEASAASPEETTSEPQTYEEPEEETKPHISETTKKIENLEVEIEKLKTILETVRETGHVTEETIQAISENIGELRSLVFQTDASLKETMVKMEKIEDDVSEVQPKEITKKFRDIDAQHEKYNLEIEKMQTKLEDATEKLTKMYDMIKSIGGIENLVDINKKIQEKLKEVEEAVKYIGRIGAKSEKEFMDLSRGMDDMVMFKARQEDLDESLREIIKSIDALNAKQKRFRCIQGRHDVNQETDRKRK